MSALKMMSVVARKELMDGLRDRRAIYTLIFSSLFGPALIAFMFTQLAGQERAAQEIQIPITGRANGPLLVHWLEQQPGVQVVDGPEKAGSGRARSLARLCTCY